MTDFDLLFKSRMDDGRFNTSYPLRPQDWAPYRVDGCLPFDACRDMCFYLHIPFCQHLCAFCEYTRMVMPPEEAQLHYVATLASDVKAFLSRHRHVTLHGLDIGGGTPLALAYAPFAMLMDLYAYIIERTDQSPDFEPSIEGTFQTVDEHKTGLAAAAGIRRMSFGIQSTADDVLACNRRRKTHADDIARKMDMLHDAGIAKINLDFMYGLKRQTTDHLDQDVNVIRRLMPEQVTLYELRTNMLKESAHIDARQRLSMYSHLHDALTGMGYHAPFGQNTFSLSPTDMGLSSYLRHRMTEGMPYKGFGISAQSMNSHGVSYNVGKNHASLTDILPLDSYGEEYTYRLPAAELASKYVAISSYGGAFSMEAFMRHLGERNDRRTRSALLYCLDNGLVTFDDRDTVRITPKGFRNIGAVFSLFYPNMN